MDLGNTLIGNIIFLRSLKTNNQKVPSNFISAEKERGLVHDRMVIIVTEPTFTMYDPCVKMYYMDVDYLA